MRPDSQQENLLKKRIDLNTVVVLRWLRYMLNPDSTAPDVTDWTHVFEFARKQALTGICIPEACQESMPKSFLLGWIGQIQMIEQRNRLINKRIVQLFDMMEKDGFECCLLKGQGNALKYPNPLRRTPGDIDIWVKADQETAYRYVQSKFPNENASFKHIHFPIFNDVRVDVHVTPLKLYSHRNQKRLKHWIERHKEEQFAHHVTLSGVERTVSAPTDAFNAVYQMGHMLTHFFDEGLGLKQVVDYFYVLQGLDSAEYQRIAETFRNLGMLRFARALMWVETEVLGLPSSNCIVEPNERLGKKVLDDILEGGNFGHHTQRFKGKQGFYNRGTAKTIRIMRLFKVAPRECGVRLLNKIGTAVRHTFK